MRRLLLLAGAAAFGWWMLRRRRPPEPRAVIGFDDGSTMELEPGSVDLERMVAAARSVVAA